MGQSLARTPPALPPALCAISKTEDACQNTRVLGVVISGALTIGPVARAEVVAAQSAPSFGAQGRGTGDAAPQRQDGQPGGGAEPTEPQPGAQVPEHVHEGSAEFLYVMSGEMTLVLDGQKQVFLGR